MSGWSEQISLSEGVASTYACYNCCPDSVFQTGILPTGTQHTAVGGIQQFAGNQRDVNCMNQFQPWYYPSDVTWESTEIPVALIDEGGLAEAVGTGFSIIRANWESVETTTLHTLTKHTNVALQPGSVIEANEWLPLGLERYFPTTGDYEIQAVLTSADRTKSIESNIVNLNVREPTGADLLAYNLIKNSSFQDILFSGAEFRQVENTLLRLSALYPGTAYGKSASFVLGEVYFYRKDYVTALTNLTRLENATDFVQRNKVTKYLSEIRRIIATQSGTDKSEIKQPK